jgi:hypothetical protein
VVDSGAASSAFPTELASVLGVDLNQCDPDQGETAAGVADQYVWREAITVTAAGRDLRLMAAFSQTPLVLLGQKDFFSHFEVKFDWNAQCFSLCPYR